VSAEGTSRPKEVSVHSLKLRVLLAAGALAIVSLGVATPGVAAYGRAEQPLAQIEFSANCNNPSFPLCAPPPNGFGLGGVWFWIEIDAGGTGDIAGAGCGHDRAGSGGAGPIRGEITWWGSVGPEGEAFFAVDPNNLYYNVSLGDGGPAISFPQTVGHYSFMPAPGVNIQTQIAP
jgi:hypothetical protein